MPDDALDKIPPHSIEAEMCAIASMMLDADVAREIIATVDRGDFHLTDHAILFDVLAGLTRAGRPVDAVILRDELKRQGNLDAIGGSAYIAQVLGKVPSAAHGVAYAKTVKATATRRHAIVRCDDTIRRMYAGTEDEKVVIAAAVQHLLKLQSQGGEERFHTYGQILDALVTRLRDKTTTRLIPTGIAAFDRMFGGVPVGLMTLIAARPAMGKSLVAKDIARRMAQAGRIVLIISVEETQAVIAEKAASIASGYDNRFIHQNTLRDDERDDVIDSLGGWRELPIYVVDDASKLSDIENVMMTGRAKYGAEVVIVDHVHRIDGEVERNTNRTNEVGKISASLANLAKRLDVALIACAQLNRGSEHTGEKPKMSDLRDSGSLEQDARMILMLYREDYYHKADPAWAKTGVIEVIVDKNSNGATGVCPLPINLAAQRIEDEGRPTDSVHEHMFAGEAYQ